MSTDIILSSPPPPPPPPTCPYNRHPQTFTPLALFIPIFAVLFFLLAFSLVHFFRDDLRDFLRRRFPRRRAPPLSPCKAKPGLDRIVLDSFPVFLHGKVEEGEAGMDCPVCLSEFEEGDEVRLLTVCCHAFHAGCIDRWLLERDTCPVCRSELTAALPGNAVLDDRRVVTVRRSHYTIDSLLRWMEERPLQSNEDGRMHG